MQGALEAFGRESLKSVVYRQIREQTFTDLIFAQSGSELKKNKPINVIVSFGEKIKFPKDDLSNTKPSDI